MKFNIYPGYTAIGIVVENDESKLSSEERDHYYDLDKRIKVRIPEMHGLSPDFPYTTTDNQLYSNIVRDEDLPWVKVHITPGFSSDIKKKLYPKGYSVYVAFPTGDVSSALVTRADYVKNNISIGSNTYLSGVDGNVSETKDAAEKLWALGKAQGMTDAECAGMLGNINQESGYMDPTTVEGVYDEPFKIGPKKERAIKDGIPSAAMTAYFWELKAFYDSYGKSIAVRAYNVADGSDNYCVGLGLIGWTGPTGVELVKYAQKFNKPWYDFAVQIANMLGGGTTYKDRYQVFLENTKSNRNSIEYTTACWLGIMEMGLDAPSYNSVSLGYSNRLEYAKKWYNEFVADSNNICSKNKSFADGVVSMINSAT